MNKDDSQGAWVSDPPLPRQYGDHMLVLERGEGCRLFDTAGKSYLDMGAGIAVNALGYGLGNLAAVASAQMEKLIHVSNLFATVPQLQLARMILDSRLPGREHARYQAVHFGNSGTEANETALKYARLYAGTVHKDKQRRRILAFSGAFHGRTMGSLSVTANAAYREPFAPLIPGCEILPFNDVAALEKVFDDQVAAVIVEPIQGEGGLSVVSDDFASALNTLCRQHDSLLIADEVQSGLGRCGDLFASSLVGLEPDMVTLAKPLAGGLPLSATVIPAKVNALLVPGHHATTFGGGPVTSAVALEVWKTIDDPDFLDAVRRKGELLASLLTGTLTALGVKFELRGMGLLRGLRLSGAGFDGTWLQNVISMCRDEGLILLKTGVDVIRFAPPLVISEEELKEGVTLLADIIQRTMSQDRLTGPSSTQKHGNRRTE